MRSPQRRQQLGHRVLGQPVNLQIGVELAQLVGDGHVALGMPEPDGRGDEQGALRSGGGSAGPAPRAGGPRGHEVAKQQVDLHRVARVRAMAGPLQGDHAAPPLAGRQARAPLGP